MVIRCSYNLPFIYNNSTTTDIYTLSLHDALPIWGRVSRPGEGSDVDSLHGRLLIPVEVPLDKRAALPRELEVDRKSTRLNSSHTVNSYAVFCLKKKKIANGGWNAVKPLDGRDT